MALPLQPFTAPAAAARIPVLIAPPRENESQTAALTPVFQRTVIEKSEQDGRASPGAAARDKAVLEKLDGICEAITKQHAGKVQLQLDPDFKALELVVSGPIERQELSRLVCVTPRLKWTDATLLSQFLHDYEGQLFANVQALTFAFSDQVSSDDTKRIRALFPQVKELSIQGKSFALSDLRLLVDDSQIDCLAIQDCESEDALQLMDWKCCSIFLHGKCPTDTTTEPFLRGCTSEPGGTLMAVSHIGKTQLIRCLKRDEGSTMEHFPLANFADRHLFTLMKYCAEVEDIKIEDSPGITDKSVTALAKKYPGLQGIGLAGCENVTNRGFMAFAEHCPKLHWIDFGGSNQLDDATMNAIAGRCPGITFLFLHSCSLLTDAAIEPFFTPERRFEVLELSNCPELTDSLYQRLTSEDTVEVDDLRWEKEEVSDSEVSNDQAVTPQN